MVSFSDRMAKVTGSAIRELFKLLGDPEIISFGGGNPSSDSFPITDVKDIINKILDENGVNILQYGSTEGFMPLKRAIIEKVLPMKGLSGNENNLLITSGSSQGMDLMAKIFVNPGDKILVEAPTFLGALQTYTTYQADIVPVPMDDEGVIIEELDKLMETCKPKFFYCIPTFQNPTGKTLGIERRKQVAELARKHDVIILEDDPYCDLRYTGEAVPNIKCFDTDGHVILLNSFSKIVSPGMRVGYIFGEEKIIRKLTIAKQSVDTHTPNITQAVIAEYLMKDMLYPHIEAITPSYAKKMNVMLDSIKEFFPKECKYTVPEGGLFIWAEMPKGVEMLPVFKRSVDECKVAFIPGEHFYPNPEMGKHTLRLNFSAATEEQIRVGIERLGKLLKEYV